jgi:hypothetical protein
MRKIDGCLYSREQVLTSVLCFPSQGRDLLLISLLLGNIPRDLRCADNLAFGIFNRRKGQRNSDQAAMLALSNGLEMVDTLSSSDARQNFTLFALPVFRDHNCNGLTDRLFSGEAKDALGTPVPACDNAVEIFAYNRFVTGLYDGRQPAQLLFTFAKLSFDPLVFGNVTIDLKHGAVTEQLHPAVYNDIAAILAGVTQLA